MTVLAFLPSGNIKLRGFWSVIVEVLFIWYASNLVVRIYVGSTTGFKEQLRIQKCDINSVKVRRGVANHLFNFRPSSASKLWVFASAVNRKTSCTKWWRYWQSLAGKRKKMTTQSFTLSNGLNNPNEWCDMNRRGCRKYYFYQFITFLNLIKSIYLHLTMTFIEEIFEVTWFS